MQYQVKEIFCNNEPNRWGVFKTERSRFDDRVLVIPFGTKPIKTFTSSAEARYFADKLSPIRQSV